MTASSPRRTAQPLDWLLGLPLPLLALQVAHVRLDSAVNSPWLWRLAGAALLLVMLHGLYEQFLRADLKGPSQQARRNATGLLSGVALLTLVDLCFMEPRLGPLWWGLALPWLWDGAAYVLAAGLMAAFLFGLALWARNGWRQEALRWGLAFYALDTVAAAFMIWYRGWYWELLLHFYVLLSGLSIWQEMRAQAGDGSASTA